jgi:hypothetical protein
MATVNNLLGEGGEGQSAEAWIWSLSWRGLQCAQYNIFIPTNICDAAEAYFKIFFSPEHKTYHRHHSTLVRTSY